MRIRAPISSELYIYNIKLKKLIYQECVSFQIIIYMLRAFKIKKNLYRNFKKLTNIQGSCGLCMNSAIREPLLLHPLCTYRNLFLFVIQSQFELSKHSAFGFIYLKRVLAKKTKQSFFCVHSFCVSVYMPVTFFFYHDVEAQHPSLISSCQHVASADCKDMMRSAHVMRAEPY